MQRDVQRADLLRSVPFQLVRTGPDDNGDGLTLEGYGATFDNRTLIHSWEGRFFEQIARGAFKKSLSERTPRMQFDHGMHPLIGSIPIGRYTEAREDSRGVFVRGRLTDNWLVAPIRDAIAEGAIDGMSFRFSVVRDEWHDGDGVKVPAEQVLRQLFDDAAPDDDLLVRTLKEVKVDEIGPVVWPAYESTTVGVRSGTIVLDLNRLHMPDQRRALAEAVFLADAAQRSDMAEDSQPEPAGETDVEPSEPQQPPETGEQPQPAAPLEPEHPAEDRSHPDAPPAGHPSVTRARGRVACRRIAADYRERMDRVLTRRAA